TINAATSAVTIVNDGDLNLGPSTMSPGGTFNVTSGGVVTLPTVLPASFGNFDVSAQQTNIGANIRANTFSFTGTTNFTKAAGTFVTVNGASADFNGNVQTAGDLTFVLPAFVSDINFNGPGVWSQGSHNLTLNGAGVNNFNIAGNGSSIGGATVFQ